MLRLVLLMLLLTSQPVWAADMWEEACKNDLAEALDSGVVEFEISCAGNCKPKIEIPRKLGAEYALCIDKLIAIAEQKNWGRNKRYRQRFIGELKWMRGLLNGDMGDVNRLAKFYRERNSGGRDKRLALLLHLWAVGHKYAPAEFDLAQGYVTHDSKFSEWRLRKLAEKGYLPAIEDMARRYLNGEGVDQNKGEGWYWLKRAQQENVDTSSITQKSLNRLLEEMDESEMSALTYLAHVHDDLDLSGIKIPPPFLPLTVKIPEPLTDQEVAAFAKKFKGIGRKTDNELYNSIERELVARTAGLRYLGNVSIDAQIRPFGMDNDEFMLRKCNYRRAIGKIFPQGRDQKAEQLSLKAKQLGAKNAVLTTLFGKFFVRYITDTIECGRIYPNPESQEFSESLIWAKGLDQMAPAALRELAAKHFEKSGSVSKSDYKQGASGNIQKNELESILHFILAGTILKFADYKEPAK